MDLELTRILLKANEGNPDAQTPKQPEQLGVVHQLDTLSTDNRQSVEGILEPKRHPALVVGSVSPFTRNKPTRNVHW